MLIEGLSSPMHTNRSLEPPKTPQTPTWGKRPQREKEWKIYYSIGISFNNVHFIETHHVEIHIKLVVELTLDVSKCTL